jgi:hypothetical protein
MWMNRHGMRAAAGPHFARAPEELRGRSGRSHVMGVIELLILAFLVGIPALIVADGL